MKPKSTFVLALFGIACGPPPLPGGDDHGEGESGGESTTSSTSETGDTSGAADTESTDSTEDETTSSAGFVPLLDMAVAEDCDPWAQDCPEGEKCVPYGSTGGNWDDSKCVPVMGDQAPGEPCHYSGTIDSFDDCDETSFCWDVMAINGERIGVCTLFCTGTADEPECPEGSACLISNGFPGGLCISQCNPLIQDCLEGFACYWAYNGFNCIFTTQNIPTGEPCGYINDCAEGNMCLDASVMPMCAGSACCGPFCSVMGGDAPCAVLPGTSCVPFFEENTAPRGYDDLGVCILQP
jgi:hypothetical protein